MVNACITATNSGRGEEGVCVCVCGGGGAVEYAHLKQMSVAEKQPLLHKLAFLISQSP